MNGYDFTERVRKVLGMAREEAARLHHEYVGTEHILLGVIREGDGIAATMLQNLDIELNELERLIDEVVKKGKPAYTTGPDLPYTSRAKKVLELAMAEASEAGHTYVGTEHLLLGLLREQKGIAAQILVHLGLTTERAREEMLRILGTETETGRRMSFVASGEMPTRRAMQPLPRFLERLRTVIAESHKVAGDRSVTEVTPAHLAIALLQHREGMANAALAQLGLDYGAALLALNDLAPMGTAVITSNTVRGLDAAGVDALRLMDLAQHEARAQFAGTQHLLVGLLAASPEVAAVFSAQEITLDAALEAIESISG